MMGAAFSEKEKLWTKSFVSLGVINLVMFIGFQMLNATFTLYIAALGGSEAVAGVIAGIFSVSAVLTRPFAGWLLDHAGRGLILFLSLLGLALTTAAYPFIKILVVVAVLRFLHGIIWSGAPTAATTAVCDILPRQRFTEGMGIFGTGPALSMAVGPLLGLWMWQAGGHRLLFFSSAGFSLLALLVALIFLLPLMRNGSTRKKEGRLKLGELLDKSALPPSVVQVLFNMPHGCIMTFIALYSLETGVGSGSVFFAAMAFTTILSRVFLGKLADRRGEQPLVILGCCCVFAGMVILAVMHEQIWFIAAALIYGVGFGIMPPTMQSMATRSAPPERRGAASSTYLCAFDIGIGAGSILAGYLIKFCGYGAMFAAMSACVILAAVLYFGWAKKAQTIAAD